MIPHDCSRQAEVVAFIECEQPTARSGWFLDRFFRERRTRAEKLEIRKYSQASALPLLYTGACQPPNLIAPGAESVTLQELTWPTIKAETPITGCDIDERRILPNGDLIPVGMDRFNEAFRWGMKGLLDGLRATHISEAITLLKTGGYVIRSKEGTLGTVDYGRKDELVGIDLSGTPEDWTNVCSSPFTTFEAVLAEMMQCGAGGGGIDIIYGATAWKAAEAHMQRQRAIDGGNSPDRLDVSRNLFTPEESLFLGYNDVHYKGATQGGQFRHWVSFARYLDYAGVEADVVAPGEILIVAGGFDGQRVFRTVTSDNREEIPDGGLPFFVYDDLDEEYNRKCRSFNPWIEEYHLLVPANVNGAALIRVVEDDAEICAPCVTCPEVEPAP